MKNSVPDSLSVHLPRCKDYAKITKEVYYGENGETKMIKIGRELKIINGTEGAKGCFVKLSNRKKGRLWIPNSSYEKLIKLEL